MKFKQQLHLYFELADCIRSLTVDAIEKAHSGHPGMPLGMAKVMTVLAFNFLKFNPADPTWFDRDRLILSNGHGSMLLYAFYYLAGYKDFTIEDIKNFRQLHSKTPGHPEYGIYEAIETTTGPLGQGFGNAVGMSIAQKKFKQKYGDKICNYKIYCSVGDGCLMEGISYEAASLAGHLKLNNLILLFDDNNITIDGRTNLTTSDNHKLKFEAMGWEVIAVDGHNPEDIYRGLEKAQHASKPVLVICTTIIGKGAVNKMDSELVHGAPLGEVEANLFRTNIKGYEGEFTINLELLKLWRNAGANNQQTYTEWKKNNPDFNHLIDHLTIPSFRQLYNILNDKPENAGSPNSTRAASGYIISELTKQCDQIICGSADLSTSNNIKNDFSIPITKEDFSGNFLYYGIREHAMAAIMNGLALSGLLPIGGTFLSFSDYMKPAIRLSAMMHLKIIYIMTHDSIGVGEDGPTHQPVEQLAMLRAIPGLLVLRPADFIETLECWRYALISYGPAVLILTRQNVPQVRQIREIPESMYGGYVIVKSSRQLADIVIFASGSEVSLAIQVAEILSAENYSIRVISIPSIELFFLQGLAYVKKTIGEARLRVAIEAGSSFGWHKLIGTDGIFFGVETFGTSGPAKAVYEYFGLTVENITTKIKEKLLES